MDREQIRQILAHHFANRLNVRMAFLFGSVERGVASTESDVDVAVYLEKEGAEGTLWTDIERLVGCEVDLVVLNRAPALIAWSAIRVTPLLIRDRGFFLDYFLEISEEAESLAEFNLDFWQLRDRARA
mgnify:FL=1